MIRPLVTVCMPTIGRTSMLVDALQCLDRQTYRFLEILLLDNASEGEGRRILQRYAAHDPRARILRCEQRLPMFANFNRGIRAAGGDFVTFLFDDDLFLPTLIEREAAMLTAHPTAGFVGSNYSLIDEAGREIGLPGLVGTTEVVPGRQYIREQMRRASMIIATPGTMYRRDLLQTFPFDEALSIYGGDLVMRLRMAEVTDVGLIAQPLVRVRVHPMTETATLSTIDGVISRARLLHDYISEYEARWPDNRVFIRSLRFGLARSHIPDLVWQWIALGDPAEAAQRRRALGATPLGANLASILALLEGLGLSARRRRAFLVPLLRPVGRFSRRLLRIAMTRRSPSQRLYEQASDSGAGVFGPLRGANDTPGGE